MSHTKRLACPFARVGIASLFVLTALALLLGYAISRPMTPHAHATGVTAPLTPPTPTSCSTGYAEPRILLDSQAWWTRTSGPGFGHVHTMLCWPVRQTVRGVVPLDIQLTMHDDPGGKLTGIVVQIGSDGSYVAAKRTFNPPLTCADTCVWQVHLDANTSNFGANGWNEFRIRPKVVESDGKIKIGSTSYQAYIDNPGKPIKNYRPADFFQGKGWYSGVAYAQARTTSPLPFGPIGGNWTLAFACDSSQIAVSGCTVMVDPDLHAVPPDPGTVLFQRSGAYKGSLVIDTTRFANGVHKVVIASDVRATAAGGTERGMLGVYITVSN